jgi:hypothetical protein
MTEVARKPAPGVVADAAGGLTQREAASAARHARMEEMLGHIARLEATGKGRSACSLVARVYARDPFDPVEVESLARSLRRWRSEKNGHCPVADS